MKKESQIVVKYIIRSWLKLQKFTFDKLLWWDKICLGINTISIKICLFRTRAPLHALLGAPSIFVNLLKHAIKSHIQVNLQIVTSVIYTIIHWFLLFWVKRFRCFFISFTLSFGLLNSRIINSINNCRLLLWN